MDLLAEKGYAGIDLEQALPFLRGDRPIDKPCVVITFDDGYRNVLLHAAPALQKHGFTATIFLPTAFISPARREFNQTECLTWDEVTALRAQGVRFGSHTVTHPKLYGLDWAEIEKQVRDSKNEIESRLGEPVTTFAYPYAFPQDDKVFTKRLHTLLRTAGYECCVTTWIGRAQPGDDLFTLKRLPVNGCDDRKLFSAKLEGAYDWLGFPQAMAKKCKAWMRLR
jgi:peptidoglycan/xylan/chitin deacetylase (PgdA/CDA1 family)